MTPTPPEHQVIVGTAGHVDHGKTALVRAMTGVDADRWEEEKRRGITIDIGFAHLERDDMALSFIDVPGHRDFVTNMLAGVHSVDIGMLVVAADESVMPQTREHLAILALLGIDPILPVITKIDLVDEETLELAELEIRELFLDTNLPEPDRFFPVSAVSGQGVADLTDALFARAAGVRRDSGERPPWLAVDRSFTMKGHGTVLTGTLMAGSLQVGDRLSIYPPGHSATIKQLNNHGRPVPRVAARKRVAVNVPQVERHMVTRGMIAVADELPLASAIADAMVQFPFVEGEMTDLTRVRVSIGSEDVLARIKFLASPRLVLPGSAWCQLRFERPCACFSGQKFIIRSYSPVHTIGGGEILDPAPPKRRGYHPVSALLNLKASALPGDRLTAMVREAGSVAADHLRARLFLTQPAFDQLVASLAAAGAVVPLGRQPVLYAPDHLAALREQALRLVASFHRDHPRKSGMPTPRLRDIPDEVRDHLLTTGALVKTDDGLALPDFRPSLTEADQRVVRNLLASIREAGLTPPLLGALVKSVGVDEKTVRELLGQAVSDGRLVRISSDYYLDREAFNDFLDRFCEWANDRDDFGIQEVKAAFPLARKYLVPLLEYLDGARITVKRGDRRRFVGPPAAGSNA